MPAIPYSQTQPEAEIPGLPESIRLLLASAVGYFQARLELFGIEAKDAAGNYVKIAICLVVAVLMLVFGLIFLMAALVYLVAWLCFWHWGWVFFGFGFVSLGVAVVCLLIAKNRFGQKSFEATAAEFKKDKEWLSQTKSTSRSQTLSVVKAS